MIYAAFSTAAPKGVLKLKFLPRGQVGLKLRNTGDI